MLRGDRQILKQRVGLEHDAEIALRGRQGGNILPVLFHRAVGLNVQPGNRAQQGGLAAAGGAEETDELALVDVDADIIQRGEIAKALGDVADAQIGHGHGAENL
jgi:hypothetical protein